MAAVAVALMVAVVTLGVLAVRSAPHRLAVTVTPPALPAAMTTDAMGCPVDRLCTVRGTPPAALRAAFARHFPAGAVIRGELTADETTGYVYRASLTGQAPKATTVTITTQCVPGGAPFGAEQIARHVDEHVDLSDNTVVTARELSALVPGPSGCSAWLTMYLAGSVELAEQSGVGLAHEASAQLRP